MMSKKHRTLSQTSSFKVKDTSTANEKQIDQFIVSDTLIEGIPGAITLARQHLLLDLEALRIFT